MDTVETTVEQMDKETWQEIAMEVFYDIAEQHGFEYAVTAFLTTLGITAVDTNTVGELMGAMNATLVLALQEQAESGSATKH